MSQIRPIDQLVNLALSEAPTIAPLPCLTL